MHNLESVHSSFLPSFHPSTLRHPIPGLYFVNSLRAMATSTDTNGKSKFRLEHKIQRYLIYVHMSLNNFGYILFSPIDEYGFSRPSDFNHAAYESFMSSYLPILVRRRQRWDEILEDHDDLKKNRQLKRFVRKGIPHNYRAKVRMLNVEFLQEISSKYLSCLMFKIWMLVSGADDLRRSNPGLYLEMLSIKVDPKSVTAEQINTDLHRLSRGSLC